MTQIMPRPDLREDWQRPRRGHRRPRRWAWVAAELRAHPARLAAITVAAILAFGGGAIAHPAPSPRVDKGVRPAPSPSATHHRPHHTAPLVDATPTGTPETTNPPPRVTPTHTAVPTPHRRRRTATARPMATATHTAVQRPAHSAKPTRQEPTAGPTHSTQPTGDGAPTE